MSNQGTLPCGSTVGVGNETAGKTLVVFHSFALAGFLASLLLFVAGCADRTEQAAETKPGPEAKLRADAAADVKSAATKPGASENTETPEVAFRKLQDALGSNDWKAASSALTTDSQEMLAGGLTFALGLAAAFDQQNAAEIEALMKRHGLDEKTDEPATINLDEQDQSESLRRLGSEISDKPAFISDAMQIMAKMAGGQDDSPLKNWPDATLTNLKIEGDSAKGTVVTVAAGEEQDEPIEFRKIDGRWLVHLDPSEFQSTVSAGPGQAGGDASGGAYHGSGMIGGFGSDPPAAPAATVEENGYSKRLYLSYQPSIGASVSNNNDDPALYGTVELDGEPLSGATAYGSLEIKPARDDSGKELARQTAASLPDRPPFEKIHKMMMLSFGGDSDNPREPVRIPFALDAPDKNAKQLDRIEGSVQVLAGGERKAVEVPQVLEKSGNEISDPILTQAGLAVKLSRPEPPPDESPDQALDVEVTGPDHNLLDVSLRSGDDKLQTSMGWSRNAETTTYNIHFDERIPAAARLVLDVVVDQKPITVPFTFADVTLPTSPENEPAEKLTGDVQQSLKLSYEAPPYVIALFNKEELFATVDVSCEQIADATRYGVVEITAAKCDTGEELRLAAGVKDQYGEHLAKQFLDANPFFREKKDTLTFQLVFHRPSADAKSIELLEGSFRIKGRETIVVGDVLKQTGGVLTNPELESLGSFKVDKPTEKDGVAPDQGLVIEFAGPADRITDIKLMNAAGEDINAGKFWMGTGKKTRYVLDAGQPLPADLKLKITPGGDEKTVIVPFKFENSPLPKPEQ